jgi:hypothetical protein
MPTKKASSKKTAKKPKKAATTAAASKVKLDFALDPARVEAIKKCLAKGKLTVTVSKVNLSAGKIRDPWLYD